MKLNDLFEVKGKDYIVIDLTNYGGEKYLFTNELNNSEEPTKIFKIFKEVKNGLVEEKNEKILNIILPVFSKGINDKLMIINEYYNEKYN